MVPQDGTIRAAKHRSYVSKLLQGLQLHNSQSHGLGFLGEGRPFCLVERAPNSVSFCTIIPNPPLTEFCKISQARNHPFHL